jgi:hypothetical protein
MGWDACTQETNSAIRWIECHPAFMGAVNDVLLVLTIIAAIAVPILMAWRERVQKRIDLFEQSALFAAGLLGPVSHVLLDVPRARAMLSALQQQTVAGPNPATRVRRAQLMVPLRVEYAAEQLYMFDPKVVARLQTALTGVYSYNLVLEQTAIACDMNVTLTQPQRQMLANLGETLDWIRDHLSEVTGIPILPRGDGRDQEAEV